MHFWIWFWHIYTHTKHMHIYSRGAQIALRWGNCWLAVRKNWGQHRNQQFRSLGSQEVCEDLRGGVRYCYHPRRSPQNHTVAVSDRAELWQNSFVCCKWSSRWRCLNTVGDGFPETCLSLSMVLQHNDFTRHCQRGKKNNIAVCVCVCVWLKKDFISSRQIALTALISVFIHFSLFSVQFSHLLSHLLPFLSPACLFFCSKCTPPHTSPSVCPHRPFLLLHFKAFRGCVICVVGLWRTQLPNRIASAHSMEVCVFDGVQMCFSWCPSNSHLTAASF